MYCRMLGVLVLILMIQVANAAAEESDEAVSFTKHIAPIIFEHCSSCHHQGQAGPFELMNYQQVSRHASTIRVAIDDNYMPPWKPISTGIEFANHRGLSESQKSLILNWIDNGCLEGNAIDLPKAPIFPDGWRLGKPDLVVKMQQPFSVPASGKDIYRSFILPVNLPEDRWIKAIELRPSARNVVHHALFFVVDAKSIGTRKDNDGMPGFRGMNFMRGSEFLSGGSEQLTRGLGGYVPGALPNLLPGDLARFLPKGSNIVMQTHFHPSGKAEVEQAELAIYFTDQRPSHSLVPLQLPPLFGVGAGLDIPAGEAKYEIQDSLTLPIDVQAIEIGGHAHYICKKIRLEATLPDGTNRVLLLIDDWDLDWQDQYLFKSPIDLPRGTKLSTQIVYDNSKDNPENPFSPPKRIAWGRESTDEMGSVTLLLIAKNEAERDQLENLVTGRNRQAIAARVRQQTAGLSAFSGGRLEKVGLLKLFDRNGDGKLQLAEVPERSRERLFEFFDSNGDDELDELEISAGRSAVQRLLNDP